MYVIIIIIIILTGRCLLVAERESQGPDTSLVTIVLVSGVTPGLMLVNICCLIIISLRESLPVTGSQ